MIESKRNTWTRTDVLSIAEKVVWLLQQLLISQLSLWMRQHYGQVAVMDDCYGLI